MKVRLLVAALALALAGAGTALGRGTAFNGRFQSKIAGKAAAVNGTWVIAFKTPNFTTTRNGKVAVRGTYSAAEGTMTFIDASGPYACKGGNGIGIYDYTLAGKTLKFKPLAEGCKGRQSVLTAHPFTKIG